MNTLPAVVETRKNEILASIQALKTLEVVNHDTSIQAGFAFKKAKEAERELEETRKQITKPLDEEKAFVMDQFRPALAFCVEVQERLEGQLKAWKAKEEKRLEEARRAAKAQAEKEAQAERERLAAEAKDCQDNWDFENEARIEAKIEKVKAVAHVLLERRPLIRGITSRDHWHARVIDEALIPREYMAPDLKKLGELARSMKGQIAVTGVEFYKDSSLAG